MAVSSGNKAEGGRGGHAMFWPLHVYTGMHTHAHVYTCMPMYTHTHMLLTDTKTTPGGTSMAGNLSDTQLFGLNIILMVLNVFHLRHVQKVLEGCRDSLGGKVLILQAEDLSSMPRASVRTNPGMGAMLAV